MLFTANARLHTDFSDLLWLWFVAVEQSDTVVIKCEVVTGKRKEWW